MSRSGLVVLAGTLALALSSVPIHKVHGQQTTVVKFPSGVYVVAVKESDPVPVPLRGEWYLQFDTLGVYRVVREGREVVLGEYQIRGDTLLLSDRSGETACDPASSNAVYVWVLGADGLTLRPVQDLCEGRRSIVTLRALMVKP